MVKGTIAKAIHHSGIYKMYKALAPKRLAILTYHRITYDVDMLDENLVSATPDSFDAQMAWLAKNFKAIPFGENYGNGVIITFDDGYLDNFKYAVPILKRYKLPATFFLTAGFISEQELPWWDKVAVFVKKNKLQELEIKGLGKVNLKNKARAIARIQKRLKKKSEQTKKKILSGFSIDHKLPRTFMNWDEVRLVAKERISFGAHTVSHPILTRTGLKEALREIKESKDRIEGELSQKVRFFAYPNGEKGDFDSTIIGILKREGFEAAVTTIYGLNSNKTDRFMLRRIGIERDDDINIFKIKLSGMLKPVVPIYKRLIR